ncbi:hypothetical protein R5M92_08710 [Halomonas sp. Bachu 37]|uniref:hypothetical protein n=1 Tax=Halomonas kashgarensis TaxID=3084920 RepID=UPI0032174CA8
MDTRESKTKQELKEHAMDERIPEDFDKAEAHRQPEARKSPNGMHKMIPIAIAVIGVVLVGLLLLNGMVD